jgi:hypothetical protein
MVISAIRSFLNTYEIVKTYLVKGNFLGKDQKGNEWYVRSRWNGKQSWAKLNNGEAISGGVNLIPRDYHFPCVAYVSQGINIIPIGPLRGLKILLYYLSNYRNQYNDAGMKVALGIILSGMDINICTDQKPAEPWVWPNWKTSIESLEENVIFLEEEFSCKEGTLNRGQSFMTAFQFLDNYFWKNNNDICKGEVIEAIEACINDFENEEQNPLWEVWLKYFRAELEANNEYSFD